MPSFAGSNRDGLAGADRSIGAELLGWHGLFEPVDLEGLGALPEGDGIDAIITMISVDHEAHLVADRLADSLDDAKILLQIEAS